MNRLIKSTIYVAIVLSLIACGGSGSQDGTGRPPANERQVTSIGTITSEDTLTVNGVEYDASEAEVTIDNELGTVDELELGQVVKINGTLDEGGETGKALAISYDTNVFGPVDSINTTEKTISILGQTIRVTGETLYAGESLYGFIDVNERDNIRVVGFILDNNDLVASYIERVSDLNSQLPGENGIPYYEVNGRITGLNINEKTFNINGLTVNYNDIVILDELSNGLVVEVLGTGLNFDNQFLSTSIKLLSVELAEPDTRVELEGFITLFRSLKDFEINDAKITTNEETIFIGGTANNIDINKRVEVEGNINNEGILVAERVIVLTTYLTSHRYGDILNSDTVNFAWADVQADEYRLTIINNSNVIFDEYFSGLITSVTIEDLPINSARLYVSIYSKHKDLWLEERYFLYSDNIISSPQLLSHDRGDILTSSETEFVWSDIEADEYRLTVSSGNYIIYDQVFNETVTSAFVNNLPTNGIPLRLDIYARHGNSWSDNNYYFTSYSDGVGLQPARLISHTDGETLESNSVTFVWTDVGADEYRIQLSNYLTNGPLRRIAFEIMGGETTSITIDNLPENGAKLYFLLFTMRENQGSQTSQIFLNSHKNIENAKLTNYSTGDTLISGELELNWTDVNADEYHVQIQTPPRFEGDNNVGIYFRQDYSSQTQSSFIDNLPIDGRDMVVYLYTRHGLGWAIEEEYILTTPDLPLEISELTSHEDGDFLDSTAVLFEWRNVNADTYTITITREDGSLFRRLSYFGSSRVGAFSSELIGGLPATGEELTFTLRTNHSRLSDSGDRTYRFRAPNLN